VKEDIMSANKKKLTKKEQKALNHAKLMGQKGSPAPSSSSENSNVVQLNAYREKDKKAA
jgi:hypothetical protein